MFKPVQRHAPRAQSRFAWPAALALCAALVAGSARAQATLGFEQALRLAQLASRQLASEQAAADAARDMAVAAGQRPDPTLKVGIDNLPVSGPERLSLTRDFMTMRSVSLMQELTRSDKLKARAARFDREAEAADAARALALANLRRETATAWLARHYQERIGDVLREQRSEAALQIDAAQAAYRGGRGAQADVFAARAAVAAIDDRLFDNEAQVAIARTRLARWVGAAADHSLAAAPDLNRLPFLAEQIDAVLPLHPEIATLDKQQALAQADANIAQSNRHADWSVELMISQRGPGYSNMASVFVSIPLQTNRPQRQDRELAARLATVERTRALRDEAGRVQRSEALAWLHAWHSGRQRLAHYDNSLVVLASQRTHAALAAYRGGTATLTAVLDARRAEIDTRIERLRLEMDTAALWARLSYLIPTEHASGDIAEK